MRAKFGRNPTVGSKKVPFKFISRCTILYEVYVNKLSVSVDLILDILNIYTKFIILIFLPGQCERSIAP